MATYTTPTSRTTGISSATLPAGGNVLGSSIDPGSDILGDLVVEWSCGTAPSADKLIKVYLLYAVDGTSYADGSASVDPKVPFIATVPVYADTGTHRYPVTGIMLGAQPLKVLLVSELAVSATVTVLFETYSVA